MNTRLLILTSRKNYIWVSMEEIISWIEKSWEKWAIRREISFKIINVDDSSFAEFTKAALTSDLIVVTCFNASIASFLTPLRGKLSLPTPWIFYLHGLASFGCWPLFQWKVGQSLTSKDAFVGSCSRDQDQFNLVFKNIPCRVIPFGLHEEKDLSPKAKSPIRKFVFIGRITSQKNLHSLILALSILKNHWSDSNWEMHFFGKPDNYGSPLMGRRETNYQKYLEELTLNLKVSENIHFHGFLPREEIESMMEDEQWIFVSPSMHSDENFGMAAFRSLINGHQAILSDWGGHHDFEKEFSNALTLLPVYHSEIGPFMDIKEMVEALKASRFIELPTKKYPHYYSQERLNLEYDEVWKKAISQASNDEVSTTPLLNEILQRRDHFIKAGTSDGSQIYADYQDGLKDVFFKAYGEREYQTQHSSAIELCPWVNETSNHFEVKDPHRGQFSLKKSQYQKEDLIKLGLAFAY
jgi:glycosyltransferase involved in cell wall biosynthesis